MVHSGKEISALKKYFHSQLLRRNSSYNFAILSAPAGSGKHLIAKALIQNMQILFQSESPVKDVYINCRHKTPHAIFSLLLQEVCAGVKISLCQSSE